MKPFSKKSWHSTIYKLTYGYDKDLPTNLCPYFWKVVIGIVLTFTLGLFLLPFYILNRVFTYRAYRDGYISLNILLSLVAYSAIFLGYTMIAIFFTKFDINNGAVTVGLIGWGLCIVTGVWYLIEQFKEWRMSKRGYRPPKEKKPSLVAEFIKAKYNKYCPKITWRD